MKFFLIVLFLIFSGTAAKAQVVLSAQITVSNTVAAVIAQSSIAVSPNWTSGNWASAANGASTGLTTITISGLSNAPACSCTIVGASATTTSWCGFTAQPTSTTLLIVRVRAGAVENGGVNIVCVVSK